MTLDEARAKFSRLGFALYALDAGGPVTPEAHDPGGELWSWTAPTEAEALAKAFPAPVVSQTPPSPALLAGPEQPIEAGTPFPQAGSVAETTGSVFD